MEEIKKIWHLPQPQAAKELGVCVSTPKRHFYTLMPLTKWPYQPYGQRKKYSRVNNKKKHTFFVDKRCTVAFLVNKNGSSHIPEEMTKFSSLMNNGKFDESIESDELMNILGLQFK